jgi:pyridoxine 4-dehydrogenase
MQLTGPGHWYHPTDPDAAKGLLRRVIELSVNHVDTADAYGPETVEHLIRKGRCTRIRPVWSSPPRAA